MIRSLLYVPGSASRFIEKAHLRGADAIIVDLEDAVAPNKKIAARQNLKKTVTSVGQKGTPVFVRVNNDAQLLYEDCIAACRAGAFGLYLPKISDVETLKNLDELLSPIEQEMQRPPLHFVPLIEDALGVIKALEIATGPRVYAISAGSEDLATSMGGLPTPEVLYLPKLLVHMAAKAAGVLSFGLLRSVADYKQIDSYKSSIAEARDFGFDGASCIHPSIVELLNEGFVPSEEELARAHRLVAAAQAQEALGVGAFNFEGDFIDAPITARARALISKYSSH
ncbi:CoA ester lyase [Paenalcaligenes niemegkensis]|uniref:HpcH/HpaI aldolase/citrate lyase family protein n=1 Tax=Paenalcaligenes niemegkensis TaxID=2895469 RepID=UPI001EE81BE7|nr:CoA ester lyase [Paenalcaligenes niemegkensis]MCQ9616043.1 CoA ester lyase [Paenalcaligenes niemegkensis]